MNMTGGHMCHVPCMGRQLAAGAASIMHVHVVDGGMT